MKNNLRPCEFKAYDYSSEKKGFVLYTGFFHAWGFEAGSCEGDGNYSVGICEDNAGVIHTPMPTDIRFVDKKEEK